MPLEKNANIVIADHARKGAPPGSISWKFIEQSVVKGELEDVDDHRAGPPAGTIREVGSAQPGRKGRTPFTAEDDRILMEWCVKAERKGLSLRGNDLYKQLEAKVKRTTYLCWGHRLTNGRRIIDTLSSHGETIGSRTYQIARDLLWLKKTRMKVRRKKTNFPKTTAQNSDHRSVGSKSRECLQHNEMLLRVRQRPGLHILARARLKGNLFGNHRLPLLRL